MNGPPGPLTGLPDPCRVLVSPRSPAGPSRAGDPFGSHCWGIRGRLPDGRAEEIPVGASPRLRWPRPQRREHHSESSRGTLNRLTGSARDQDKPCPPTGLRGGTGVQGTKALQGPSPRPLGGAVLERSCTAPTGPAPIPGAAEAQASLLPSQKRAMGSRRSPKGRLAVASHVIRAGRDRKAETQGGPFVSSRSLDQ